MEKILYICRGISGAGKSTFAKTLGGVHFEADMFFINNEGEYKFDGSKIKDAHNWCQNSVEEVMKGWGNVLPVNKVVVSNTFTQEWEMEPYFELARKYGYKTFSIIIENRHGGVNQHGVPEEKLEQMRNRFNVKL
jgi:predicted kinase